MQVGGLWRRAGTEADDEGTSAHANGEDAVAFVDQGFSMKVLELVHDIQRVFGGCDGNGDDAATQQEVLLQLRRRFVEVNADWGEGVVQSVK